MVVGPRSLVLRSSDGRKLTIPLSERVKVRVRRGDSLSIETSSGEIRLLEPGQRIAGRVRSLNPGRRELTVDTATGPVKVHVLAGTVLFKENQPGNWLELHQGEPVAALGERGRDGMTASSLFDALSFIVRELEPSHGTLLAQGQVTSVSPSSATEGTLTLGQTSLRYDRQTRWQLGARFTRPQDFQDVEALVFGSAGLARMVLSRRAVPFVFETLSGQ